MKVVFFGLGSIGSRHARLLKDKFKHDLIAYRSGKSPKKNNLGIKEVYSLKEVLDWKPDVAFITNPTAEHMKYMNFCAKRGIGLFIEKPISHNEKGISELIKLVKKNKIKTYVAYCLRFHPGIVWLKKHLKNNVPIHANTVFFTYMPNWRKNVRNHLTHYSSLTRMGGGVILDISHEVDYFNYLFGDFKELKVNSSKISNVTKDAEDFADILVKFDDNFYGNMHINFYSGLLRRELVIDFKDHTVVVDLVNNFVKIFKPGKKEKTINFKFEVDDMYFEQLKYFFSNLGKKRMMNDLKEALPIFENIMEIKEAVK